MVVSEANLYNVLKDKLGENEAQAVVEGIKQEVRNEFENKKYGLSTKEDMLNLKMEIEKGFRDYIKWTVGAIIASAGIILSIIKLM
jgi:hypothetical protein